MLKILFDYPLVNFSLRSSTLNVDGAMRTLRDIVSSHSLSPINNPLIPPIPRENQSNEEESIPLIESNPIPLRDEVSTLPIIY